MDYTNLIIILKSEKMREWIDESMITPSSYSLA
jgi:hypothetical protein